MNYPVTSVGLRALKENLAHYVSLAREGEHVIITDRGQEVAELVPLSPARRAIQQLVELGEARWNGKKPGLTPPVPYEGPSVSDAVLEDRDDRLL